MLASRTSEEENSVYQCTADDALSLIGSGRFQYTILLVTGMIWSTDAIEMMILTFLLPILADEWNLNPGEDGTIGAALFAGMLFGAIFWPQISDRFGRRRAIICSNIGQITFGMLSAIAWNLQSMIMLRFLTGFCLGGGTCSFTLYAEFAPKGDRGKLLVLQQSFWAFGALFNALLAWLVLETLNWRWYVFLSSVPLCLIFYFVWQLPESVLYLVSIGKTKEAETILKKAMEMNTLGQEHNNKAFQLIPQPIIGKRGDLSQMFDVRYFATTITCFILMSVITFSYYGVSFLSERFFDYIASNNHKNDTEKYWKVAVTTSSEIPGILVGMLTLDKIGRKYSLTLYCAVVAVCMLCLMNEDIQNMELLSVSLVFIGRGAASIGFFVLFVYFGEYYPTQIRNSAIGTASAVSRIAGMGATYVSQSGNMSYSFYLLGLASTAGVMASVMLEQDTMGVDMSGIIKREPNLLSS